MKEIETNYLEQPAWLELPEEISYWQCTGTYVGDTQLGVVKSELYLKVFSTADEAEAEASIPRTHWKWDRQPASPVTLAAVMHEARSQGYAGVVVKSWREGKWITVKHYLASEPLP
jgi:hypothetical protein